MDTVAACNECYGESKLGHGVHWLVSSVEEPRQWEIVWLKKGLVPPL